MRLILATTAFSLASGFCCAQTAPARAPKFHTGSSTMHPVDKGPYTPQANAAYQGGGVILQGAPGAPAPLPQRTPPGLAPKNAVPHS